jgi:hypothetical protein
VKTEDQPIFKITTRVMENYFNTRLFLRNMWTIVKNQNINLWTQERETYGRSDCARLRWFDFPRHVPGFSPVVDETLGQGLSPFQRLVSVNRRKRNGSGVNFIGIRAVHSSEHSSDWRGSPYAHIRLVPGLHSDALVWLQIHHVPRQIKKPDCVRFLKKIFRGEKF